ncbi:MAG: tetratricopeptide repeat protein, partial [Planctomicrobium sp.]|nr:tetratricopeptide repeat protein [Planctomicrobium sp.]
IDGYTHLGQTADARRELEKVITARPDLLDRAPIMHARLLLQEGKTEQVAGIINHLLLADKNDLEALLMQGKLLVAERKFSEAIQVLEQVLRLSPSEEQALYQLGQAHARIGDREKGKQYLDQHRKLLDAKVELYRLEQLAAQQPQNGKVRLQLAKSYKEIGLDDMAKFWTRSALATGDSISNFSDDVNEIKSALNDKDFAALEVTIRALKEKPVNLVPPPQMYQAGRLLHENGRLTLAEWCYQQSISLDPNDAASRRELASVQYVSGRYQDAHEQLVYLLAHGGLDLIRFPLLGNQRLRWGYEDRSLETGLEAELDDPLIFLGLAHRAFIRKEFTECEQYLETTFKIAPNLPEAWVLRMQNFYETTRQQEIVKLTIEAPSSIRDHADYWVVLGLIARDYNQIETSVRCFAEALLRDPIHYKANAQLGGLLQRLGREDAAKQLLERSELIRKYAVTCQRIHDSEELGREAYYRTAVSLSESIGCLKDAVGWCTIGNAIFPELNWPISEYRRLSKIAEASAGRWSEGLEIGRLITLEDFPRPRFEDFGGESATSITKTAEEHILFKEVTDEVGIEFVFQDGADQSTAETLLFEFTGGGVAAWDYDKDGWSDLYFVQGGQPPQWGSNNSLDAASQPLDKLYRNLGNGRFSDTGHIAEVADSIYGQGVTVGDYNSDGFPDLYVASIGQNILYENNGDGTLTEVVVPSFAENQTWTTSVVLADLNHDGLADIYDVTYVTKSGVHSKMCKSGEASIPCFVEQKLEPEQDRFFLNLGDGRFREATAESGFIAKEGIGLGVVAADFNSSGQLELFVANDARANFLFVNQDKTAEAPRFTNEALIRGLAYNSAGRLQACMGVAVDDANQDGLLDLFVTNFYADDNTYYQQTSEMFFDDRTVAAGLHSISYNMLGFGTQFIDIELDGNPDLVITNGDVVDFTEVEKSREYRQRPQCLLNQGQRRFQELHDIGDYFQKKQIGRGLVKLDWNRDGREEFAVSHLGTSAALLKNETKTSNHSVDIRLVARDSHRDAIGTSVTVTAGKESWTKQLTAGDGYLASNQRHLLFGLGTHSGKIELSVNWSSGAQQTFQISEVDKTFLLVEGLGNAFTLPDAEEHP